MAKLRTLRDADIDTCSIKVLRESYKSLKAAFEKKSITAINRNTQLRRMKITKSKHKKGFLLELNLAKQKVKNVRHAGSMRRKRLKLKIWKERYKKKLVKRSLERYRKKVSIRIGKARVISRSAGKEVGLRIGYRKGRHAKYLINRKKAINKGRREGYKMAMKSVNKRRLGHSIQLKSLNSLTALTIIYSRLQNIVPLRPQYIALLITIGQYEAFQYRELKEMFSNLGGDAFYTNISYLKKYGYLYKVSTAYRKATWALTPLGQSFYNKLRKFIHGNYLKLNKSEDSSFNGEK